LLQFGLPFFPGVSLVMIAHIAAGQVDLRVKGFFIKTYEW